MLEGQCDNTEAIPVLYEPQRDDGTVATLDGPLRVEVIGDHPGAGFSLDPTNPLRVYYKSGDSFNEDIDFDVIGDADLGAGVREIRDRFTLHVRPKEATRFGGVVEAAVSKASV